MSSLALMRWLEAAPERYDAGMRLVTLGRVERLHDAVARAAAPQPGAEVLEVGCGTGSVTLRLLVRGARVTALDQNPEMLAQARRRVDAAEAAPGGAPRWLECTASEIDALPRAGFDAVVMSLCLSEMSAAERRFVLARARERLRPGGRVVAADEVRAHGAARWLQHLVRGPQWLLAWGLAGSVSRPVPDLPAALADAGLRVVHDEAWLGGTLAMFVAEPAA